MQAASWTTADNDSIVLSDGQLLTPDNESSESQPTSTTPRAATDSIISEHRLNTAPPKATDNNGSVTDNVTSKNQHANVEPRASNDNTSSNATILTEKTMTSGSDSQPIWTRFSLLTTTNNDHPDTAANILLDGLQDMDRSMYTSTPFIPAYTPDKQTWSVTSPVGPQAESPTTINKRLFGTPIEGGLCTLVMESMVRMDKETSDQKDPGSIGESIPDLFTSDSEGQQDSPQLTGISKALATCLEELGNVQKEMSRQKTTIRRLEREVKELKLANPACALEIKTKTPTPKPTITIETNTGRHYQPLTATPTVMLDNTSRKNQSITATPMLANDINIENPPAVATPGVATDNISAENQPIDAAPRVATHNSSESQLTTAKLRATSDNTSTAADDARWDAQDTANPGVPDNHYDNAQPVTATGTTTDDIDSPREHTDDISSMDQLGWENVKKKYKPQREGSFARGTYKRRKALCFRGRKNPLSNFFPVEIKYRDNNYNCVEQGYQHTKAEEAGNEVVARAIMKCKIPRIMKEWGDKIPESPEWNRRKGPLMRELISIKVNACEDARKVLETSGDTILAEAVTDPYWATGLNIDETQRVHPEEWPGQNIMGQIWMEEREKLLRATAADRERSEGDDNTPIKEVWAPREMPQPNKEDLKFLIIGNSNCREMADILCSKGAQSMGIVMPGANIDAISHAAQTMSTSKPEYLILQALDIDVANKAPMHHLYHSVDNMIHTVREAYKDSHIIIAGLPTYKDDSRNTTKTQLEQYIKHKLSSDYRICLMDNSEMNLKDELHFSRRSKVAFCQRLCQLTKPHPA